MARRNATFADHVFVRAANSYNNERLSGTPKLSKEKEIRDTVLYLHSATKVGDTRDYWECSVNEHGNAIPHYCMTAGNIGITTSLSHPLRVIESMDHR